MQVLGLTPAAPFGAPPPHLRAQLLQLQLHEEVDRRQSAAKPAPKLMPVRGDLTARSLRAEFAELCVALGKKERVRRFEALRRSPGFQSLPHRLERAAMRMLRHLAPHAEGFEAGVEALEGAGFLDLEPRLQGHYLAALRRVGSEPTLRSALVRVAQLSVLGQLPLGSQKRIVDVMAGLAPRRWSDPHQKGELVRWWSSRFDSQLSLLEDLERADEGASALAAVSTYLDGGEEELWLLSAERIPGALIVCFGSPLNPGSLAYVRLLSLDAEGRMSVRLKSPVAPIRHAWSQDVDPEGLAWGYRRFRLSRRELLALVRWIEDNHRISGPEDVSGLDAPPPHAHEAALELDLRAPQMIALVTSHRGPLNPETGVLARGQVSPENPAKAA